jgi:hypothetical protein
MAIYLPPRLKYNFIVLVDPVHSTISLTKYVIVPRKGSKNCSQLLHSHPLSFNEIPLDVVPFGILCSSAIPLYNPHPT